MLLITRDISKSVPKMQEPSFMRNYDRNNSYLRAVMKIAIDKKKYNRKFFLLVISTLIQFVASILVLFSSFSIDEDLSSDRIIIVVVLLLSGIMLAILLRHFISVRKHKDCAVSFESGVLNDYTKQFNKVRGLKIEDIDSVSRWKKQKKVNQYRIKTKGENAKNYFLSDYIIDSKELLKLAELIALEVGKRNAIKN